MQNSLKPHVWSRCKITSNLLSSRLVALTTGHITLIQSTSAESEFCAAEFRLDKFVKNDACAQIMALCDLWVCFFVHGIPSNTILAFSTHFN